MLGNVNAGPIRQILLTGSPGIGKTTLVLKICELLSNMQIPLTGFYTKELRAGSSRIGFDILTTDGKHHGALARKSQGNDDREKPKVGCYEVDVSSFESIALPALDNRKGSCIMIIDEIGKMELLFSKKFEKLVQAIFENEKLIVLATVPNRAQLPFVEKLKRLQSSFLIEVDHNNRNSLADSLADTLKTKFETLQRVCV